MSAAEAQSAHAASEAGGAFNPNDMIMHHILDQRELEIPFTGQVIHLPKIEVAGIDVSITRSVVMMWIACAILLVMLGLAARRAKDTVPRGLRNLLEILILFIRDDVARKVIGPGADRYLPYLLTTFFFILTCNLLGMVPGMSTATGSISVTAALALIAFGMIQLAGIREHGVLGHMKNLLPHGLPWWLVPIMLPVEIMTMFTKPFALCVRLFANMTAGHVVILSLISLIFIMKTALAAAISVPFALFVGLSAHPAH